MSATPKQLFTHPISPFRSSEISLQKINAFSSVFQKRRFCAAKQPLLPCKTYAFAMRNNRFWNAKS
ncbi:hypothetical protein CUB97_11575 [Prevotella intermedia]|uniref:Uncharacterized protein n=1 Tax=Prevotella intermedia TaxID=28131 RepID=A0A2M8M446_PREIN|nr:hypothetical protein CUB97_11575 [Prevotella intermedia]